MKTALIVIAILAGVFLVAVLPPMLYSNHIETLYPLTEGMSPRQQINQLGHRMDMYQSAMETSLIVLMCLAGLKIALFILGLFLKTKS